LKVQVKTPEETFKAFVQSITYHDDGRLIHFNAHHINETDLKLPQSYFAHDIDSLTHDSDNDSFNFSDLPNNQLALLQTPEQPVPIDSDNSPDQPSNPEMGCSLPIQADNGTIDVDLIKLCDYPGYHHTSCNIPFQEWCQQQNISPQMVKDKLFFGLNDAFVKLKRQSRHHAMTMYQIWVATFPTHSMPFHRWLHLPETPKLEPPMDKLPSDHTIDLTEWHLKAYELAEQAPRQDRIMFHKLRSIWTTPLFRSHYLDFANWLDSQHRPSSSNVTLTQADEQHMHTIADICPYDEVFQHLDDCAIQDKLKQIEFILEDDFRQLFEHPDSNLQLDMFLQTGIFAKVHVPNYIHVPSAIATFYRLEPYKISNHIQHLLFCNTYNKLIPVSHSFQLDKWSNRYKLMNDAGLPVDHKTCTRLISMTYSSGRSSFLRAKECRCILVL
jgi:hypothetical protein